MKYETLEHLLEQVGLQITNKKWTVDQNNGLILEASVGGKSLNNQPSIIEGATHKGIRASGSSLAEITRILFDQLTIKEVFIGAYNSYTEKISWSRNENKFTKRLLTKEELMKINCPL